MKLLRIFEPTRLAVYVVLGITAFLIIRAGTSSKTEAPLDRSNSAKKPEDFSPIRDFSGQTAGTHDVALSADGKLAASACDDRLIYVWDVATGKLIRTLQGHTMRVMSVAFSPDNIHVVSGSHDGTLHVWNTSNGDLEAILERHPSGVLRAQYVGTSQLLSSGYDDTVRLWDIATEKEVRQFACTSKNCGAFAISPDAKTALISGPGSVELVDLATGNQVQTFPTNAGVITLIRFNPDGKTITAATARPNKIFVWNKDDASVVRQSDLAIESYSVGVSPDGSILCYSTINGSFVLIEGNTGKRLNKRLTGGKTHSWASAFSTDGRYVFGGCLGEVDPVSHLYQGDNVLHL